MIFSVHKKAIYLSVLLLISLFCMNNVAFAEGSEGINIPNSNKINLPFQSDSIDTVAPAIDKEEIQKKAESVNPSSLIEKSREGSLTLLYIFIFIVAGLFFIGAFFATARKVAFVALVCGLVGFTLINYTEDILAILLSIVDSIAKAI